MEIRISKTDIFVVILAVILAYVLTACAGFSAEQPGDNVEPDGQGLPLVAAVKAREALAGELDIRIEDVDILISEQKIWSDSCLGLGGPAESCLKADVEGWLVELSADGDAYFARTDWLGEQVRFES
jgi:hypothetical protein